jgi:hypothetical protein
VKKKRERKEEKGKGKKKGIIELQGVLLLLPSVSMSE